MSRPVVFLLPCSFPLSCQIQAEIFAHACASRASFSSFLQSRPITCAGLPDPYLHPTRFGSPSCLCSAADRLHIVPLPPSPPAYRAPPPEQPRCRTGPVPGLDPTGNTVLESDLSLLIFTGISLKPGTRVAVQDQDTAHFPPTMARPSPPSWGWFLPSSLCVSPLHFSFLPCVIETRKKERKRKRRGVSS